MFFNQLILHTFMRISSYSNVFKELFGDYVSKKVFIFYGNAASGKTAACLLITSCKETIVDPPFPEGELYVQSESFSPVQLPMHSKKLA